MENKVQNTQYMLALGRLFQLTANKKFGLESTHISNDEIWLKALEINKQISFNKGIDIFDTDDITKVLEYENILTNSTIDFTRKNIPVDIFNNDEEQIIINSVMISVETLRKYELIVPSGGMPPSAVKALGLTYNRVISYVRTSENVMLYRDLVKTQRDMFFISTKVKPAGKPKIFFALLGYGKENFIHHRRGSYATISLNSLMAYFYVLLDFEIFQPNLSNPVKIFFELIEKYCKTITVGGLTGKFIKQAFTPTHIENFEKYIDTISTNESLYHIAYPTDLGTEMSNMFAFNFDKFLKDYSQGKV